MQMRRAIQCMIVLAVMVPCMGYSQGTKEVWLDELSIPVFSQGIPAVVVNRNAGNDSLRIGSARYDRGLGVHSTSILYFLMNGRAHGFSAVVGADDQANPSMITRFYVVGDKKILFASGDMRAGDPPKQVHVNLEGIQRLGLLVTNDKDAARNYSDWADAKFIMSGGSLPRSIPNDDEKYILTPPPPALPRINSPKVFGARPGNPFLFTVVATGETPITYSVDNLPEGLVVNAATGIISGSVTQGGVYHARMKAKNRKGETTKDLVIKIGDTIALTPPMGWNGWNSWAREIDKEKVLASADAMVKMELNRHGWTYINIDDAWQGQRGGKWNALQPNEKFPGFKAMVDEIHAKGLKLGVYSTPWISSYAGYPGGSSDFRNGEYPDSIRQNKRAYRHTGKYRFEKEDALQMAEWGVDYLKYDWRIDLVSAERMAAALKNTGRDILYSLSNSAPFALAGDWARIANAWRTGPDIRDSWQSLYTSVFTLDKWAPYGGPGHWNDPDMMILGNVTTGAKMHPTRLTPDEQYSHVSLFSLLSAPLLIGCPIEQLDAFTLNLLTNDEVIDIDQDPLGKPARLVATENDVQVWLKTLEDGSYAVGMFNIDGFGKTPASYFRWGDEKAKTFTLDLAKLGLKGRYTIRNVWKQQDMGEYSGVFTTEIRHHGVMLIRLSQQK